MLIKNLFSCLGAMLDKIDGRVPATAGMNTPAGMPQPNLDNKIAGQSGTEVQSNGANGNSVAVGPPGSGAPGNLIYLFSLYTTSIVHKKSLKALSGLDTGKIEKIHGHNCGRFQTNAIPSSN